MEALGKDEEELEARGGATRCRHDVCGLRSRCVKTRQVRPVVPRGTEDDKS